MLLSHSSIQTLVEPPDDKNTPHIKFLLRRAKPNNNRRAHGNDAEEGKQDSWYGFEGALSGSNDKNLSKCDKQNLQTGRRRAF